jgi:hypothetical protein
MTSSSGVAAVVRVMTIAGCQLATARPDSITRPTDEGICDDHPCTC